MSKTKLVSIRIESELKKRAKTIAKADGRSLSNWITRLIMNEVKKQEKSQ